MASPQHSEQRDGKPVVSKYSLAFYPRGGIDVVLMIDLGKPAPQADGVIRVDFDAMFGAWPLTGEQGEAVVFANGADGSAASPISNPFIYSCAPSASPTSLSMAAGGGTGTLQVTAERHCGWTSVSRESWITVPSGSQVGAGSVAVSVAANNASVRTGTVAINGATVNVTQAAKGAEPPTPEKDVVYLSDMTWTSMTNGWGPAERDRSNGEDGAADGQTIMLNGRAYPKGLGVHAGSRITYQLDGRCSTLKGDIGVDDEVEGRGSVAFSVIADGKTVYKSATMDGAAATQTLNVNIAGARELALVVVDTGDNVHSDHASWADIRVTCPLKTGGGIGGILGLLQMAAAPAAAEAIVPASGVDEQPTADAGAPILAARADASAVAVCSVDAAAGGICAEVNDARSVNVPVTLEHRPTHLEARATTTAIDGTAAAVAIEHRQPGPIGSGRLVGVAAMLTRDAGARRA